MSSKAEPLKFPVHIPFVEELGLELHRMADGEAELRVDLTRAHLNSWAVAHGGVLMTMLDVAMAHAARSIHMDQPDGGPGVVTIEMKTSFMQPAVGALTARGELMHRTATMAFTQATVFDAAGRACAHSTGTFKFVKRLPTGSKTAHALNAPSNGISTD